MNMILLKKNGYVVSRIEVQNPVFLDRDENVYICREASPQQHFASNVLHQIFGF
jgi:hypothetical protein